MPLLLLPFTTAHDFRILLKNAVHIGILVFLGHLGGHIPSWHERPAISIGGPYPLIQEIASLDYCIFCNYHLLAPFQFSAACLIRDLPVPALYGVLHIQEARLHSLGMRAPIDIRPGAITRYTLHNTNNRTVFACYPIGSLNTHSLARFLCLVSFDIALQLVELRLRQRLDIVGIDRETIEDARCRGVERLTGPGTLLHTLVIDSSIGRLRHLL